MFRLLRFVIRWTIRVKIVVLAVGVGMAIARAQQLREDYRTWGRHGGDEARTLAGDDLVAAPDLVETRTITIDAPPAAVWPWLVQMGYGRGGWYSYQPLDRPWRPGAGPAAASSDVILDAFQGLAVGDVVPTHLEGGFVARTVERDSVLVLFLDDAMAREQVQQLVAEADDDAREAIAEMDLPPFSLSWAFLLEAEGGAQTRFTERMRVHVDAISEPQRRGLPLLRTGLFVLMRSQMQGIAARAEGAAGDIVPAA